MNKEKKPLIEVLAARWYQVKKAEKMAIDRRREIEDEILELLKVDDTAEGTESQVTGEFKLKITTRLNQKVDLEKIEQIAEEHGLDEYLTTLFRFKPEVNKTNWKKADKSITDPFLEAITIKPARPTVSAELIEGDK